MKTFNFLKVAWHYHRYRVTKKLVVHSVIKKPLLYEIARVFAFVLSGLFEAIIEPTNALNDDADIAARLHGAHTH